MLMRSLEIDWLHAPILVVTPVLAGYALLYSTPHVYTVWLAVLFYFLTALSITAGYHRYYSHRSYRSHYALQVFYAFFGAAAMQGSIRWWSRGHRVHHRYTDTDADPYNAKRGLFWSHIGWMMFRQKGGGRKLAHVDMRDLDQDPLVKFQHRFYPLIALFSGVALPILISSLWGDPWGGFFYPGMVRLVFCHHATFSVNSIAHYFGEHTYTDTHTPRDHFVTALITMGEGYHNFHHEFPNDYRNAVRWWQYDPTKWFIRLLGILGLTWRRRKFPKNEVLKGKLKMWEKWLDSERQKLWWAESVELLPSMTYKEFKDQCKERRLLVISGVVYDVGSFMDDHPGGKALLLSACGRDATADFKGAVHAHRLCATHILETLQVARASWIV